MSAISSSPFGRSVAAPGRRRAVWRPSLKWRPTTPGIRKSRRLTRRAACVDLRELVARQCRAPFRHNLLHERTAATPASGATLVPPEWGGTAMNKSLCCHYACIIAGADECERAGTRRRRGAGRGVRADPGADRCRRRRSRRLHRGSDDCECVGTATIAAKSIAHTPEGTRRARAASRRDKPRLFRRPCRGAQHRRRRCRRKPRRARPLPRRPSAPPHHRWRQVAHRCRCRDLSETRRPHFLVQCRTAAFRHRAERVFATDSRDRIQPGS